MKVRCPVCKKKVEYEGNVFRPFCSERCKKRDLGAWASEEYAIAGKGVEIDEENVSTTDSGENESSSKPVIH